MKRTYSIGVFVGNMQCGYSTGKTRAEAIKIINAHSDKKCIIYCPQTDSYVSEYFKKNFMKLNDPLGILMFDEGQTMISRIDEGLVFRGNILLTNKNEIKRDVKFKFDEDRFVTGVLSL
jgi:hypothetical protein